MRNLLLVATLGLTVCHPQPLAPASEVSLGQPFTLRLEQTVEVSGTPISMRFDEVGEDSRCHTDVDCIWEGNARVRLTVAIGSAVQPLALNTGLDPRSANVAGYVIALEELGPGRTTSSVVRAEDYIVTLRVTSEP